MTDGGGGDAAQAPGGQPWADAALLDAVLEGAEVGVWILDLDTGRAETIGPYGRIVTGRETPPNFSFPSYEAFLEIVHPDDRERIAGSVSRNLRASRFEDEFRVIDPDDTVRWVLSRSRVMPGERGGRGRVVGVVMDVTARREAARRRDQLHALTEVGLSRLPLDDLLDQLLQRVAALVGSDTATILLLESDGRLRVRASVGLEPEVAAALVVPLGEGFAGRIAATGEALGADLAEAAVATADLHGTGLRYLLGVPLVVEGRTIGVLHVGRRAAPLGEEDLPVLRTVADRVALAIDRARAYEHQRSIADTLQHSLLPYQLPRVPGIRLAAAYRPGLADTAVGGDWYDVVALPDGRVAVTIGDVAGHGVEAARTMGQLRDVTRLLVAEGRPIEEVLSRLNHVIGTLSNEELATAVCTIVDPAKGTVSWANAGHPPPLLRRPDGSTAFLGEPSGPALGASPGARYTVAEAAVQPGSKLVLYTDGLVERRTEDMSIGLEWLAVRVAGCEDSASVCCDELIGERGETDLTDDIAVVVVEVRPRVEPMHIRFPNEPASLAPLRTELRAWLRSVVEEAMANELVQAAAEAAAKAVVQRDEAAASDIAIAATCAGDTVEICIRDWGPPRDAPEPPSGTDTGRGLLVMEALTDELIVLHQHDGTEVILRRLMP